MGGNLTAETVFHHNFFGTRVHPLCKPETCHTCFFFIKLRAHVYTRKNSLILNVIDLKTRFPLGNSQKLKLSKSNRSFKAMVIDPDAEVAFETVITCTYISIVIIFLNQYGIYVFPLHAVPSCTPASALKTRVTSIILFVRVEPNSLTRTI